MEALYITIIVLISLFCDFMLWQHFSACFEMQFKLTNQIISNQQFHEDDEMKETLNEVLEFDFDITGNEVMQHIREEE